MTSFSGKVVAVTGKLAGSGIEQGVMLTLRLLRRRIRYGLRGCQEARGTRRTPINR